MKSMKVLTLCCLLSLGFFCKSANAQMYIVTDRLSAPNDSVFVTNPAGITTKYKIPGYSSNIGAHDSQLNVILNDIITLGYKLVEIPEAYSGIRTFYFAKP